MARLNDTTSDLLFGLIAVESGLIGRDALFAVVQGWPDGEVKPLGRLLVEHGLINEAQREFVARQVVARTNRQAKGPTGGIASGLEDRSGLVETLPCADASQVATIGIPGTVAEDIHVRPEPNGGDTQADGRGDDLIATQADGSRSPGPVDESFTIHGNPPDPGARRFRVLNSHASGGLGVIFVALDAELNREVALKQIKDRYASDPASRSRFLLEAEITGGLEHPGIVPVYGLGTDAEGRLYYAMRFIRGDSLADAIAKFHSDPTLKLDPGQRSLELRKLLMRFHDICDTIEYAHGRGVLHRDIKPANIMVGRYGETLVVDWGIAKVTGRSDPKGAAGERPLVAGSGSGSTETLAGTAIGSPSYMSPEQAAGDLEHLGVGSDVYSLGATLYNLITGRAPVEGPDLKSVLDAARRGEFRPPRAIDPSIDPALEAVCLKAMALKPADRYLSAHALAEDVERWMADEPVSARADPPSERLRRWMRRRKTAVTAAAAAVFVAMAGLAVVLAVEARANRELRAANQEVQARFALAQKAIRTFHSGVSEDLLLGQQEFTTLKNKLLVSSLDFYKELEGLLKDRSDRPSREALARSYFEVGEVNAMIGSKSVALEAHRKALALRESLAGETDAGAESVADVGRSKLAVGMLEKETGDPTGAERDVASGRSLLEGLDAKGQGTPEILADLALGFERMGALLEDSGRIDQAVASHEREREIWLALVKANPFEAAYRAGLAKSHQLLGSLLDKQGKTKDAIDAFEEARGLRQELVDASKERLEYQYELATIDSDLAGVLVKIGRTPEAIEVQRRALEIREGILKASPNVTRFQDAVARGHFQMGYLFSYTGNSEKAVASFRRARDTWQGLMASNPSAVNFQADLTAALQALGSELARAGRTDDALKEFVRARVILEKLVLSEPKIPRHQFNLALIHIRIGLAHVDTGQISEGLTSFEAARDIQRKLVSAEPNVPRYQSDLAWSFNAIGEQLARVGRSADAAGSFGQARRIQEDLSKDYPNEPGYQVDLERTETNLGRLLFDGGDTADGLALCARARDRLAALAGANPDNAAYRTEYARTLKELGAILSESGRDDEARRTLTRARDLCASLAKSDSDSTFHRREFDHDEVALATLLARSGELNLALASHEQARESRERLAKANAAIVDSQADLAGSDDEIAALLSRLGQHSEALAASERAQEGWKSLTKSCPSVVAFRLGLARSLRNLGELLDRSGERDAALGAFRSALAEATSGAGQFREVTAFPVEMALTEESLGALLARDGRADEAAVLLRGAAKRLDALARPRPGDLVALARVHARLSGVAAVGNRQGEARAEADLAMASLFKAVGLGFHSPDLLNNEDAFAPLGSRADFRIMMTDLVFPTDPFRE